MSSLDDTRTDDTDHQADVANSRKVNYRLC